MSIEPSLKERLKGMNALIRDVYERSLTISSILTSAGFADEQVTAIRDQHLEQFLHLSTLGVRCGTCRVQSSRLQSDVRELYYGFGHTGKISLDELAKQMGVSRQRVYQIKDRSLRHLRPRKQEDPLLEIFRAAANATLGIHLTTLAAHFGIESDESGGEDEQVDF